MTTTFQLQVEIDGETKTFITGADDYGQAVHAVEEFLEADKKTKGKPANFLKVAPKRSIIFVPSLNGKPATDSESDEPLNELGF